MSVTISIIVATYNASKTVEICLESILLQKSSQVQLLIIDGDSQDSTQTIVKKHLAQIDYFISEKDSGIYDAWNKGIAKATGEWIMFIGADDTLEPGVIGRVLHFVKENDTSKIDYISGKNTYLDLNGREIKVFGQPWNWDKFRRSMKVAHVASLHNRALFHEVGTYNVQFRICGDYELLLRKRSQLRCLFMDFCIARMATGCASYSIKALREAHRIRKLHSGLASPTLAFIFLWQVLLFVRHRFLNQHLLK